MAARLSQDERIEIEIGLRLGQSRRSIARRLGRAASTICREIGHSMHDLSVTVDQPGLAYQAARADRDARQRRARPRVGKLAGPGPLRAEVLARLRRRHSPRQIALRLVDEFPDRPELRVSHETIYQAIYLQSRGSLRAELARQVALRSGRAARRPRAAVAGAVRSRRPWLGANIAHRPAEAADRAVPGHWEGDLLIGARHASAIATLVERATRYLLLVALPAGRVSEHVVTQLAAAMTTLPAGLRRSLTWDQGAELAHHHQFTIAADCPVYFCDPHSPWQRGSNENTNGLLRQYFPKGAFDFRTIDQAGLDNVAAELNERPRETLKWRTPAEKLTEFLDQSVATTN